MILLCKNSLTLISYPLGVGRGALIRFAANFTWLSALCLILLIDQPLQGQSLFQNSGNAARTMGLGGPHLLGPVDAATAWWNPAALAGLREHEFIITSTNPFAFSAAGVAGYWPRPGSFGFALAKLPLQNTNLERVSVAWAYSFGPPISVGLSLHGNRFLQEEFFTSSIGIVWHPLGGRLPLSRDPYQAALFNAPLTPYPFAIALQASDLPIGTKNLKTFYAAGLATRFYANGPALLASFEWQEQKKWTRLGLATPVYQHVALYGGLADFKPRRAAVGLAVLGEAYSFDLVYSFADKKISTGVAFRLGLNASDRARRHFDGGMVFAKTGHYRAAHRQFQNYLKYEPEKLKTRQLDHWLIAQIQRDDEKIAALMREADALEKTFRFVAAAVNYINVLKTNREHRAARQNLLRLAPRLNLYIQRQYRDGAQFFNDGQYAEARDAFEGILLVRQSYLDTDAYLDRIYTLHRQEAEKFFVRGLGYYEQENYPKALEFFQQAQNLSPNYPEAQSYLERTQAKLQEQKDEVARLLAEGNRLAQRQQFLRAYRAYREVLGREPENETAKQQTRLLQSRIDAFVAEKLQAANRAFEREDYAPAGDFCKQVLEVTPRQQEAAALLQRIEQVKNRRAEDFTRRGLDFFAAREWNRASDEFEKALSVDPDNRQAQQKRQEALSQSGIQQLAEKAQSHFTRGQYSQALEVYKMVLDRDPRNAAAQAQLKECQSQLRSQVEKYFKRGLDFYTNDDYENAVKEFDKALSLEPLHKQSLETKQKAQQSLEALKRLRE